MESSRLDYYQTPSKQKAPSHKSYSGCKGLPSSSSDYYGQERSDGYGYKFRGGGGKALWVRKEDVKRNGMEYY